MDQGVTAAFVAIPILCALFAAARSLHLVSLRERAKARLVTDEGDRRALAEAVSDITRHPVSAGELATYASVTAAEFTWNWANIDPHIIGAAAFSSATSIHSGLGFAQYLHQHFDHLGAAAQEGFLQRLMGYAGERHVADILLHQGHTVQVAATPNQAVWDLLVDGHMANVKTVADVASIKAEAAAHPWVTYIVPEDAHGHATGNIVHLAGFKHDAIKESLKESVSAAHGEGALHGLCHHIPWITIGFAAYRNIKAVEKGTDPVVALHHGAAEVIGRGGGILAGAKVGGGLGTLFGPIGTFLGALGGALVGAIVGSAGAEAYKQLPLRKALQEMERVLHEFGYGFKPHIAEIRDYLHAPLTRMRRSLTDLEHELTRRKATLRWWLWPDFYTVLLDEAAVVGRQTITQEAADAALIDQVLREAQQTKRYEKVGLLMANSPVVCELIGFDRAALERVRAARQSVLYWRKQLNPSFVPPL